MKERTKSISGYSMLKSKTFLAIIPARGGSKRLPKKNILPLHGKPLIAWTIEAAIKSHYIDKIIVSSEDSEILETSTKYNIETIKRPCKLATDTATTYEAVEHAIKTVKSEYDFIVLLQPTSPLRNEKHIDEAINLLVKKEADAIVSVCAADHPPLWCNILPEDHSMKGFLKNGAQNKRSQDFETYFRLNGAIYICKTKLLLQQKSFMLSENIFAYIMDRHSSVDIDEKFDFHLAECMINAKN